MPRPAIAALSVLVAVAATAAAQQKFEKVRPGPWTKDRVPAGWVLYETRNYQIQSQCGLEKAKRLGEHMEVMNKTYRAMFHPDKEGEKRQTIKLFKDSREFHTYGAPAQAAAYYKPSDREMVCYDTGKWMDQAPAPAPAVTGGGSPAGSGPADGTPEEAAARARAALEKRLARLHDLWKMDLLGCAAHEGWHQYFHWYVTSFVELPSWVNEGMGDYFYTAVPKVVKGRQVPAELGRINAGRLMIAQAALRQDRFVDAPTLLRYSKQEYYANAGVCYAEGWSLCQFLLHGGNDKYAKVIPAFIRLVRDDTNMEQVTRKAFMGIDLQQLDQDFRTWLTAQKSPMAEALEGLDQGEGGDEGGGEKGGGEKGGGG